ncbi:MAG: ATPase [Rhodobiaceae bacterium]|nr:ATPase [Rhodobiaceae bacterium]MCC0055765.1 ATPase [Rhodobiaceae bacterium]
MRFENPQEFLDQKQKAVTVFGMSGLGKTTIASMLRDYRWFHYSVDFRIGTRYMGEFIVDNFKREAMKVPFLRNLLMTDSIYIASNITFHNLAPLSTYLGKPGDPAKGGLPFDEYCLRQERHRQAEIAALRDVGEFIGKARDIYGYSHFVCDSGGSLCEVADPEDPDDAVLSVLAQKTLMLYIRGTDQHAQELVRRFRKNPKPMYYQPEFLAERWAAYKAERNITDDNVVDPDDFAVWGFAELVRHRQPLYEAIARNHGYVVEAEEVEKVKDEEDFLALVSRAIERGPGPRMAPKLAPMP